MMTLKEGRGKVPIPMSGSSPYKLVDFPSREVFDSMYNRQVSDDSKDKYWDILNARSRGATLVEAGRPYSITRERVRQIEARFIRLVSGLVKTSTSGTQN
jgi:hypothetical protein